MNNLQELAKRQAQQRRAQQQTHARNDICPECGGRGHHWVKTGQSSWFGSSFGFWTCPNKYGPDGRRIKP